MAAIVDRFGNPIEAPKKDEVQTSRVQWLQRTVAEHPVRGLTPERLARILTAAERGDMIAQCELFEDMEERDGHLLAEMSKRKRAMASLPFEIVAPPNASAAEKAQAELVADMFDDLPDIEHMYADMLDAVGKGFSRIEMPWTTVGSFRMPRAFEFRQPTWFQVDPDNLDRITLRDGSYTGETLRPFGWISHNHKAKSGYVGRGGLYRNLCWPFLFKNMALRDLAEFLEIYGLPAIIGKYPPGANEKEKMTLLRAVTSLGHNAAGIFPQGMDVDLLDAAEGGADPFELMMTRCDLVMSKCILGGTLTSQADGATSTNALGDVHDDARLEIRDSDARQIESTLNRDLLYPLAVLNCKTAVNPLRAPRIQFETRRAASLETFATALPALVGMGLQIKKDWVYEKLCIPRADDADDVLTPPAAPAPTLPPGSGVLRAMLSRQLSSNTSLDGLTDAMGERWEKVMTPVRDQLQAIIAQCKTLEELNGRLDELAAVLDVEELQGIVRDGALMARLFGRAKKA